MVKKFKKDDTYLNYLVYKSIGEELDDERVLRGLSRVLPLTKKDKKYF